jgi:PTS system nitrogen regulatory IIA component
VWRYRTANCPGSTASWACSPALHNPLDFEALDDQPVDLLFVLLAPEGSGADHLKALARIARVLRDEVLAEKIRSTDHATGIYAVLTGGAQSDAA